MPTAIPTSSTTDEVVESTGSQWLGIASSDMALITAVPASRTGMPAATSAPNTTTSNTSVIGTDVSSDFRKSAPIRRLVARFTLAAPASPIRSSGCCACTAATAFRSADTARSA